jgi:hypothetical protein
MPARLRLQLASLAVLTCMQPARAAAEPVPLGDWRFDELDGQTRSTEARTRSTAGWATRPRPTPRT